MGFQGVGSFSLGSRLAFRPCRLYFRVCVFVAVFMSTEIFLYGLSRLKTDPGSPVLRSRPMSTTTARGGFGATPGAPGQLLGDSMAGAVVEDRSTGPGGAGYFVHHNRSGDFIAQDLVWSPGGGSKTPGRRWWLYLRPAGPRT